MRLPPRLLALTTIALVSIGTSCFLLSGSETGGLYPFVAGFYVPMIVPILFALGGVHSAPSWGGYVAYFGGVMLQNYLLFWLFSWLRRKSDPSA